MKVSELTGRDLDLWVAKTAGTARLSADGVWLTDLDGVGRSISEHGWHPSTNWAQGGPIIERADIAVLRREGPLPQPPWSALCGAIGTVEIQDHYGWHTGPTPLIAAMRAYVGSKFGDEVPDEPN